MALALLQSLPWPQAPDLVRTVVADAGYDDTAASFTFLPELSGPVGALA